MKDVRDFLREVYENHQDVRNIIIDILHNSWKHKGRKDASH